MHESSVLLGRRHIRRNLRKPVNSARRSNPVEPPFIDVVSSLVLGERTARHGAAPSGPDPTATGGSSSPSCFWLPLVLCLGPVSLELARRVRSRASTKRFVHAPPALADALRARAGP